VAKKGSSFHQNIREALFCAQKKWAKKSASLNLAQHGTGDDDFDEASSALAGAAPPEMPQEMPREMPFVSDGISPCWQSRYPPYRKLRSTFSARSHADCVGMLLVLWTTTYR
jgi:hypothetical protein